MHVWIIEDKRWGDSDETRLQVEWQTPHPSWNKMSQAEQECSGPDMHPFEYEAFPDTPAGKRAAIKRARSVAADAFFGIAVITRQGLERVEGRHWNWTAIGEPEHVEAE